MFKTEIEYSRDTLYINLEGMVNKKNIQVLKRKLYHILDEYAIMDIVIDIKNTRLLDKDAFYELLDDYDIQYGGNLEVME